MSRFASPFLQYFDDSGQPLVDGKIYFFEPGTNTPKDTFADFELTIPNTNPVILSASGRAPNIWYSGAARAIITKSDDTQVSVRDPVGSTSTAGAFTEWNVNNVYEANDLVRGADGNYYVSLTDANEGNEPTANPANWTRVKFIRLWNASESYDIGDVVQATTDALLYVSLTGTNIGNPPEGDLVNWEPAVASAGSGGTCKELVYKSMEITEGTTHNWPVDFKGVVLVSGAGGGGGGGRNDGTNGAYGGTGGTSGIRLPVWVDQSIDPSVSITIGGGGAGSTTNLTSGDPGQNTTLGGLLTFGGGAGGIYGPASSTPDPGVKGEETPDSLTVTGWAGEGKYFTGGTGGQGRNTGSGGTGGAGATVNYRTSALDNTGEGGDMTNGNEGGGGGGSWGNGAYDTTPATKGGGGSGWGGPGGFDSTPGANGFILLEWWELEEVV